MNKRILFIGVVGGIVILVVVGFVLFMRQTKTTTSQPLATTTSQATGIQFPTSTAFVRLNGSVLSYLNLSDGNFASFDLATSKQQEFSPFLIGPVQIAWSPDGMKVLNVSGDDGIASVISINQKNDGASDGGNMRSNLGVIQTLDPAIRTPTWSGDGSQILYQYYDKTKQQSMITVAKPDGSNWQNIVAAPNVFTSLWWSKLGTYAIGLDGTTNPPQYDLIAISSKKVTKLAPGNGTLAWSPSGKLALLDSNDHTSLNIANVETREITTLKIPGSVQQFTWQDETHIVGVSNQKIVSIDLATQKSKQVGDAISLNQFAQVLGIYKGSLIYTQNGTVGSIKLNQ